MQALWEALHGGKVTIDGLTAFAARAVPAPP